MKWREDEIRECGCCGRWTANGDAFPSGNRDPRTGQTPMDNFICDRCQEEARGLRLVGEGAERFLRSRGRSASGVRTLR